MKVLLSRTVALFAIGAATFGLSACGGGYECDDAAGGDAYVTLADDHGYGGCSDDD